MIQSISHSTRDNLYIQQANSVERISCFFCWKCFFSVQICRIFSDEVFFKQTITTSFIVVLFFLSINWYQFTVCVCLHSFELICVKCIEQKLLNRQVTISCSTPPHKHTHLVTQSYSHMKLHKFFHIVCKQVCSKQFLTEIFYQIAFDTLKFIQTFMLFYLRCENISFSERVAYCQL